MGLTMNDYDLRAQELGWDSYAHACRQIANRLGFDSIEDLDNEIEYAPGGVDLIELMTDEEYEVWRLFL